MSLYETVRYASFEQALHNLPEGAVLEFHDEVTIRVIKQDGKFLVYTRKLNHDIGDEIKPDKLYRKFARRVDEN